MIYKRWLLCVSILSLILVSSMGSPATAGVRFGIFVGPFWGPPVYLVPPPIYVAPPVVYLTPRHAGRCEYWASRCSRNWSRRKDFLGCLRYHGC